MMFGFYWSVLRWLAINKFFVPVSFSIFYACVTEDCPIVL